MAHTDKTDPFWVRISTGYLKSKPVHRHEDGYCDLIALKDWGRDSSKCYWEFVYDGRNVCACNLCHGAYGEYSARRDRHKTRVDVLRWKAEYSGSGEIQEW